MTKPRAPIACRRGRPAQASWQADGNPELKARYQADYVPRLQCFGKLEKLIQGRNAASDPLQMMDERDAAQKCRAGRTLSKDDREYCATKPIAEGRFEVAGLNPTPHRT